MRRSLASYKESLRSTFFGFTSLRISYDVFGFAYDFDIYKFLFFNSATTFCNGGVFGKVHFFEKDFPESGIWRNSPISGKTPSNFFLF